MGAISPPVSSSYRRQLRSGLHFLRMNDRRIFLLQSLALGAIVSGCSNRRTRGAAIPRKSVAVLGVVQQAGLKIPVNEYRLATDLEILLREEQRYAVMPYKQARLALGAERQDLLLKRLASSGQLDSTDLDMLENANLPARMGVALTITGDAVSYPNAQPSRIRDNQGRLLNDRTLMTMSAMRSVSMTATVVELGAGRVRMHDSFTYQSVERKQFVQYTGSSFSGSLAARVANTVSNGVRTPDHPEAPGLYGSFYELLNDVAQKLPIT